MRPGLTLQGGGLGGLPVGAVLPYEGVVFPGFIMHREGGVYDVAVYPQLLAYFQAAKADGGFPALTIGQINAGVLPDYRDYSPRTAGGALGPELGALQQDQFQGFGLRLRLSPNFSTTPNQYPASASNSTDQTPANAISSFISDGVNGTPRFGSETRAKTFGVRYQIKAFGAVVNQGTADLVAIQQAYQNLSNKAVRGDVVQAMSASEKRQARVNAGSILTEEYVSPPQIFTLGGALTLAHGLGAKPKRAMVSLQCFTADAGYAVNDELIVPALEDNGTFVIGASIVPDATNLNIRFSNSSFWFVPNKSTGERSGLAPASWRLILRAWA